MASPGPSGGLPGPSEGASLGPLGASLGLLGTPRPQARFRAIALLLGFRAIRAARAACGKPWQRALRKEVALLCAVAAATGSLNFLAVKLLLLHCLAVALLPLCFLAGVLGIAADWWSRRVCKTSRQSESPVCLSLLTDRQIGGQDACAKPAGRTKNLFAESVDGIN